MAETLIRPIQEKAKVTSGYGPRLLNGTWQMHPGIDYINGNDPGGKDFKGNRNVVAIDDGIVVADNDNYNAAQRWVAESKHSLGNYIFIQHTINNVIYIALYAHLKFNNFNVGDAVKRGDILGIYSDYGFSYGEHCHFQLYDANWHTVDPTHILLDGIKAGELNGQA